MAAVAVAAVAVKNCDPQSVVNLVFCFCK